MSEQSLTLTRRQLQLLQLIEAGQGNRDIAEQLQISEHTVKVHMWRMFKKLGVGSRTGALAAWKAQNPDELTTVRAQRDALLVALTMARAFVQTDRTTFADTAVQHDGTYEPDDAEVLADYDAALAQIDAAIEGAGPARVIHLPADDTEGGEA